MTLADHLIKVGETQAAFGERLSPPVSGATVSRWLSGQMVPRPHRIREIERITRGKVKAQDWFVARTGDAA